MDMKLDGQRIRSLRLRRSWTQEMLAEKAGLNQRTVQRVEAEGIGSLRTRKALAVALDVDPVSLDVSPLEQGTEFQSISAQHAGSSFLQKSQTYLASKNSYKFTLLIILSVFYLASKPFFFSQSRLSFSWFNYSIGQPLVYKLSLWVFDISFWLVFSLPWLAVVAKKHRLYLSWHVTTMIVILLLSIARIWQSALIMEIATFGLYYATLLLLAFQYCDSLKEEKIRQIVVLLVAGYIYLWFFQELSYFFANSFALFWHGYETLDWSYPGQLARFMKNHLADLVQLLPVALVLLFSMSNSRASGLPGAPTYLLSERETNGQGRGQDGYFYFIGNLLMGRRI